MTFKFLTRKQIARLPKVPGVYCLKSSKNKEVLYIGKASNIRERVKNHFPSRSEGERRTNVLRTQQPGFKYDLLLNKIKKVGYIKTSSEIEALILEANLIKKYQPKYNVLWRDDKNYFYVAITKEDLPRIFWTHQIKKLYPKPYTLNTEFVGPFVEGTALKKTLKLLRKIFPYYTIKKHPKGLCPWCHLGLCPGPNPSQKEYNKNIQNLVLVLKGKRKSVLRNLKQEMKKAATSQDFEKAAKIRDQILALEKVISHSKIFKTAQISRDWEQVQRVLQETSKIKKKISRIEAYDISNIQGKLATGSMVTFIDGEPEKKFYRKFKIKISGKPNDIAMIKEVLLRRFRHPEWPFPDLILIDGGKAQLNAAFEIKNRASIYGSEGEEEDEVLFAYQKSKIKNDIKVMSLAKRENKLYIENQEKPILLKNLSREIFNLILQLRDEAHRFARKYHLKLREKKLID